MKNMLTRNEAVEALYRVINSNILNQEIVNDLEEIANLIDTEGEFEINPFGMSREEYAELYAAPLKAVDGVITERYIRHCEKCEEIIERYKWKK